MSRPSSRGGDATGRPGSGLISGNMWTEGGIGGGSASSAPWTSRPYQGDRGGAFAEAASSSGYPSSEQSSPKQTSGRRKRGRSASQRSDDVGDSDYGQDDEGGDGSSSDIDNSLWNVQFPPEFEDDFISAIFNIGLKSSSPKVLIQLMTATEALTTEHIKSHLQKYRLHHGRSEQEFMEFYRSYIRQPFQDFCAQRGWEVTPGVRGGGGGGHSTNTMASSSGGDRAVAAEAPHEDDDSSSHGPDFDTYRPSSVMQLAWPELDYDGHVQQIQALSAQMLQGQMELQSNLQQYITSQIRLQGQLVQQLQQHRPSTGGGTASTSGGVRVPGQEGEAAQAPPQPPPIASVETSVGYPHPMMMHQQPSPPPANHPAPYADSTAI